jgi:hypothetical protein
MLFLGLGVGLVLGFMAGLKLSTRRPVRFPLSGRRLQAGKYTRWAEGLTEDRLLAILWMVKEYAARAGACVVEVRPGPRMGGIWQQLQTDDPNLDEVPPFVHCENPGNTVESRVAGALETLALIGNGVEIGLDGALDRMEKWRQPRGRA